MKPYRKRAKGHWFAGKANKGDGEERQYSKREIQEQLAEDEENYLHRYHKGKRTRNMRARLEYRIKWYEQALVKWGDRAGSSFANYFRDGLAKTKKELEALDKAKVE